MANNAEPQCHREPAARAAALAELVLAVEQSHQELADHPAVSAEMTLMDKHRLQKEAEHGTTLGEMALAAEQRCSLSAAGAAELALATAQVMVLADSPLPKPALAEDKWCLEETAKKQHHADDEHDMAPVLLPDPGKAAIQCIWVECALLAAPFDAILAKIERDDIAHKHELRQRQPCHIQRICCPTPPAL